MSRSVGGGLPKINLADEATLLFGRKGLDIEGLFGVGSLDHLDRVGFCIGGVHAGACSVEEEEERGVM